MSQCLTLRKPTSCTSGGAELDQHLGQMSMMSQADHTGGLMTCSNNKISVVAGSTVT
jgi:hypothetical protein